MATTKAEVFDVFLLPMKRLFIRPLHSSDEDESAALAEYADALCGFHKPVLEAAWKSVRDGHTGRNWPPVAVCIKAAMACRAAFRETARVQTPNQTRALAGRMIDNRWQPFAGCECGRCLEARGKYYEDNAWWYDFCARQYGDGLLTPAQKSAREKLELG